MYKVEEAIIVEGVYDKIKLSSFIDGLIFTTGGFSVFSNKASQKNIKRLAEKTGIVILSDSDSAGLKIRNFVKQLAPGTNILNAYVPSIEGREKRKSKASKEGLLGVEGMTEEIIIKAIINSGATVNGSSITPKADRCITKADLYRLSLSGKDNSSYLRKQISARMGFAENLSANMFLDVINRMLTYDELSLLTDEIINAEK